MFISFQPNNLFGLPNEKNLLRSGNLLLENNFSLILEQMEEREQPQTPIYQESAVLDQKKLPNNIDSSIDNLTDNILLDNKENKAGSNENFQNFSHHNIHNFRNYHLYRMPYFIPNIIVNYNNNDWISLSNRIMQFLYAKRKKKRYQDSDLA